MNARVLALDLEGTLISNAVSQFPRPGLHDFIEFCLSSFDRVVMFTAVGEMRARDILQLLANEGHLPPTFARDCEFVRWSGRIKNLEFVPDASVEEILLVDDREDYVHPAQKSQWIPIREYTGPTDDDAELTRVAKEMERRRTSAT